MNVQDHYVKKQRGERTRVFLAILFFPGVFVEDSVRPFGDKTRELNPSYTLG